MESTVLGGLRRQVRQPDARGVGDSVTGGRRLRVEEELDLRPDGRGAPNRDGDAALHYGDRTGSRCDAVLRGALSGARL